MIKGTLIELVPATSNDKQKIYDWCFHSETTKSHAGPPNYPDVLIPTFEEFYNDYADFFFTGSAPRKGRGFMILHEQKPVGFISYCSFHLKQYKSELDIWLNCEANCSRGFGTDAIISLSDYLSRAFGVRELIMRPSVKNTRAICSYKKSGFEESAASPADYLLDEYISLYGDGDYGADETALLIKQVKIQLETERLYLRQMTKADFPSLCNHLQDKDVMYAYDHAFSDVEIWEGIDTQLQRYKKDGFGVLVVVLKESGAIIGQCGLSMQPCDDREVLEIGYIFQRKYWHNWYATEAAIACREYAFNQLNASEVFSLIRDTNVASQNVAKRNGMSLRGTFVKHYYGAQMPHYIFSAKKDANE